MATEPGAPQGGRSYLYPVISGAIAFVLYALTLIKGPVHWDAPLWAFCTNRAHPWITGYPLYVIIAHPFAHIPVGRLIWRMALFSAVFGGLSTGLVCHTCRRLKVRPLFAVLCSLTFALAPMVWNYSTVPEVYTIFWCFFTLVVIFAHKTAHGDERAAGWLVFVYGLSFAHHLLTALIAPAVLYVLIASQGRRAFSRRNIAFGAAAAALVVLLYAVGYFLQRRGAMGPELVADVGEYINRIFGSKDREVMFTGDTGSILSVIASFRRSFTRSLPLPLWPLSLVGFVILFARERRLAVFALAAMAGIFFFALNFPINEVGVYYAPIGLLLALALAVCLESLSGKLESKAARAALALLFVPVLLSATTTFANLKERQRSAAREFTKIEQIIEQVKPRSVLWLQNIRLANAFASVAEEHPNLALEIVGLSPPVAYGIDLMPRIRQRLSEGKTIYVFGAPPEIPNTSVEPVVFKVVTPDYTQEVKAWVLMQPH